MEFSKQNVQQGALAVGKIPPAPATGGGTPGLVWGVLYPPPTDGYVLTSLAAATQTEPSGGTSLPGVAWAAPAVPTALTTFTATAGSFSGAIGVNGATPPAKAAAPGTATGTDALVINAIALVLKNLGFTS